MRSSDSDSWRTRARDLLERGEAAILVGILAARGSTPRDPGSVMLVHGQGIAGSIGGGELEYRAIAHARNLLTEGDAAERHETFILGPDLGQCCGGVVELLFAPLSQAALDRWPEWASRGRVYLYGAGHVGQAVAKLLPDLDFAVDWIESRPDFRPENLPPRLIAIPDADPPRRAAAADPSGYHLVMTHSHDLDYAIVRALLARGDFAFLGLIGSVTKRARFLQRLQEDGIAADRLARLVSPIGLPGIAAKEPAAIAIAIAAQLLQQDATARTTASPRMQSAAK